VRRACYGIMRLVMESQAKGVEIAVSGKLRGQRAKGMKFRDGYMIKAGACTKDFIDKAIRSTLMRQGIIGIKVLIMLPYVPGAKFGPKKQQPDVVKVLEPKEDSARLVANNA